MYISRIGRFSPTQRLSAKGGFETTSINDAHHDDRRKDDASNDACNDEADNDHGSMTAQS